MCVCVCVCMCVCAHSVLGEGDCDFFSSCVSSFFLHLDFPGVALAIPGLPLGL